MKWSSSAYGYPYYWGEPQLWGTAPRPGMSMAGSGSVQMPDQPQATTNFVDRQVELNRDRGDDPHLRSCRAVERCHIHATDGDIGHLDSLLVDDSSWAIHSLVIDTSDGWLGHQTLVAPPWIDDISWIDATIG